MLKFWNRTIRLNPMGGKFYVEIKNKAYDTESEEPTVDFSQVHVFDTESQVLAFFEEQLPTQ